MAVGWVGMRRLIGVLAVMSQLRLLIEPLFILKGIRERDTSGPDFGILQILRCQLSRVC